jgi:hypothetical protein
MDMQNDILASLTRLSDDDLLARIKVLVARDRDLTAEIVAHLAELDTRDVHLREGFPSLFVYCRDALGLSDWEAYNRIDVARTARRFPIILQMLADGSLHLTAVRRLAPHLTPGNHVAVLQSARGKTKIEVQEIVAGLAPRPDVSFSVRRVPMSAPGPPGPVVDPETVVGVTDCVAAVFGGVGPASTNLSMSPAPDVLAALRASEGVLGPASEGAPARAALATPAGAAEQPPQPALHPTAVVTPLSPDRYKLQLTIGADTLERLRLAKDMLGHAIPSGDDAAVFDRALRALLAELAKKKFADARAPRSSRLRSGSSAQNTTGTQDTTSTVTRPPARKPPAAVKRAVWVRDLGRCAFVAASGHRCSERRSVEFHHVDPYALGGEASVDGIQLRCRRHNDYEGRLYFGKRRSHRELVPEQVELSVARSTG